MSWLKDFLHKESTPGILLIISAVLALIIANSPAYHFYETALHSKLQVLIAGQGIDKDVLHWINDGLMALFFLLIGLEVKREILIGQLKDPAKASLPIIAAVGGMLLPAVIYVAINLNQPETLNGWAIPAATDIAFALGILALLGKRAPSSLKIFLATLAIIDDLGAIVIIAVFYSSNISIAALGVAAGALVILFIMNAAGVKKLTPYLIVGFILWVAVLKSGVHATLAGVALAMFIPLESKEDHSPLISLEHSLHPLVYFIILPIFAFANSGVSLAGISVSDITGPVPLGIAAGLFLGKQIGVFGFSWISIKLGWSKFPAGTSFRHVYGIAALCGIGFTMSLFIAGLAFSDEYMKMARIGILTGSLVSGFFGYYLLKAMKGEHEVKSEEIMEGIPEEKR